MRLVQDLIQLPLTFSIHATATLWSVMRGEGAACDVAWHASALLTPCRVSVHGSHGPNL